MQHFEASLKKRYLFKLMTNLVGLGIGLITQSIVPRALGPSSYGNFSFLKNFFLQVTGFLSLNSSTAFYTKLSQRQQDKGLISFYFYLTLLVGILMGVLVVAIYLLGFEQLVWPEQRTLFVVLAGILAFLQVYSVTLIQVSDAYGLTAKSEIINMIQKIVGLVIIAFLFWNNILNLLNYFIFQIFMFLIIIAFLYLLIQKHTTSPLSYWRLNDDELKSYIKEFAYFCLPLVFFSFFAILEQMLDRWLVQKFSGSVQQGFYALAYQTGAICFLFVSAMIPLIMREYAISFGNKNINELRRLFSKFCPMLYAIAAYFSCFIAAQSEKVIMIFGGQTYSAAIIPVSIMCLYPIHQTYGQLNASFFFATNRTKVYRNIGISFVIVGVPLTFFLLGPKIYGGLQSGATGLAIKMVLIQFLGVNVQLWFNLKLLDLSFGKFFGHQIMVLVLFLSIAVVCVHIVDKVIPNIYFLSQFLIAGFLYTLSFSVLVMVYPRIFALRKEEITNFLHDIVKLVA